MILDKIINSRRNDIEELKTVTSIDAFIKQIEQKAYPKVSFKTAIKRQISNMTGQNIEGQDFNIIAEEKRHRLLKALSAPTLIIFRLRKTMK